MSSGSPPSHVRSWFRSCVSPRLDQPLRDRLCSAVSSLSVFHVDFCSQSVNRGPERAFYGCSSLCLPTPGSGVSAGGSTTLSQPATSVLRSHACSAVRLAHCLFECAARSFSRPPSRMVQSGLCLVGLRDVLGSSFLDLQSQVFSQLRLTSLHMSRLLGKCAKDSSLFSSSFHPLGLHAVALGLSL